MTIVTLGISIFCQAQNLPFVSALSKNGLKEIRLGSSDYYMLLPIVSPDTFKISEGFGREGQSFGFDISFKDSSSLKSFYIDLLRGKHYGSGLLHDSTEGEPFVESLLADKKVRWRIKEPDLGFYQVFTAESGNLNAHFESQGKTDINYLISIIATLKRK